MRLGDPPAQGVPDGLGLIVDFFDHEVRVAALLRRAETSQVTWKTSRFSGVPGQRGQRHAFRRDAGKVAVFQHQHVPGVAHDGGNVRREKVLPFAKANNQRRRGLRCINRIGFLARHHADRIRPGDFRQRRPHGVFQASGGCEMRLDQMHQHFGIRIAGEHMPGVHQPLLESDIVFNNAVVDQRDASGAVEMRVGIDIVRTSVGRPARVGNDRSARSV